MIQLPSQFHFLRPEWFLALLPAVLLLALLWRRRRGHAGFERICDAALLPHLLLDQGRRSTRQPLALLALAWLLATTALAGPVWEKQPQPVYRLEQGRVLVLDLSPSMAAADLTPSRLDRARYKIEDILKKSREGRTGLVVFSAAPHVVVPLTEDAATIAAMLPALAVDIMPESGDSADRALATAAELLHQGGLTSGDIMLLTDGIEDLASSLATAAKLRRQGFRLFVLGIGSEGGAPVPDPGGSGFVTDGSGAPLLARLDPAPLRELAAAGGGSYRPLTVDEQDLAPLFRADAGRGLQGGEAAARSIDRWQEEGAWLVLPILLLALAGFRRGWLACLLVILALRPAPAGAMSWQDLWQRPDQQAAKALAQGNPAKAAELFRDPAWRAVAQHQAGRYQDAAETGKTLDDAAGQYNLGNSLAGAGRLADALQAYDRALQLNPDDADARANRDLVAKILAQQNEAQQNDQSGEAGDGQQNKEKGKEQQGQDDGPEGGQEKQAGDSSASGQEQERQDRAQQGSDSAAEDADAGERKGGSPSTEDTPEPQEEQGQPSGQENTVAQGQDSGAGTPPPAQNEDPRQEQARADQEQEMPNNPGQQGSGQAGQPSGGEQSDAPVFLPDDSTAKVPQEKDLVLEQWLRQVPDDPSGLLRRKFMLEHQRRMQEKRP